MVRPIHTAGKGLTLPLFSVFMSSVLLENAFFLGPKILKFAYNHATGRLAKR